MTNDKKHKKKIGFNIFLTSVLTFFLLWVFLSESISNLYVKKVKKSDINIIYNNESEDLDLKKFWETYSLLKKKYYNLDWIKKSDLVDWAISWMVESIWDKHSEFMDSKHAKSFNDVLNWDFEWIWAVVDKIPLGVKLDRILKGSPAKKYWLLNGMKLAIWQPPYMFLSSLKDLIQKPILHCCANHLLKIWSSISVKWNFPFS